MLTNQIPWVQKAAAKPIFIGVSDTIIDVECPVSLRIGRGWDSSDREKALYLQWNQDQREWKRIIESKPQNKGEENQNHPKSVFAKIKSWYTQGNTQNRKALDTTDARIMLKTNALKQVTIGYPSYSNSNWVVCFHLTGWASFTSTNANIEGTKEFMTCLQTIVMFPTNMGMGDGMGKVDCHRICVLSCFMSSNG